MKELTIPCAYISPFSRGDRLKRLDGHEEKPRSAGGFIFISKGAPLERFFILASNHLRVKETGC